MHSMREEMFNDPGVQTCLQLIWPNLVLICRDIFRVLFCLHHNFGLSNIVLSFSFTFFCVHFSGYKFQDVPILTIVQCFLFRHNYCCKDDVFLTFVIKTSFCPLSMKGPRLRHLYLKAMYLKNCVFFEGNTERFFEYTSDRWKAHTHL